MSEELSLEQFCMLFDSEEACIDYLVQIKWPNGFICPRCDCRHAYQINTRRLPLYECVHCHHQTSPTVGTVMERSRTELRKWLIALFLISRDSHSINAVELSQIINVTYKTAWLILHKIRHAMGQSDASVLLSGFVHVNQVHYVRPHHTSLQTYPKDQALFIGAAMNEYNEPVYVKIKRISKSHISDNHVLQVAKEAFAEHYTNVNYRQVEFIMGRYKSRKYKKLFPIFSEANHWLTRTFHGIGSRHLSSYLNEFCYRLNQKLTKNVIFESLSHLCTSHKAISYAALTH